MKLQRNSVNLLSVYTVFINQTYQNLPTTLNTDHFLEMFVIE